MNKASSLTEVVINEPRELVIQISNKQGTQLKKMHIQDGEIFSLGRAWHNTIVIQDRYVDPEHLEVSYLDGEFSIEDKDTTNGSSLNGKALYVGKHNVSLGDTVRLGDTIITLIDAAEPVAPTAMRSNWFRLNQRFSSAGSVITLTALVFISSLAYSWLGSRQAFEFKDAVSAAFSLSTQLVVWVLAFGLIGRLLRSEANTKLHWILGCLFYLAVLLVLGVSAVLHFNTHSDSAREIFNSTALSVLGVVFMYGTLTFASNLGRVGKWSWSFIVVAAILLSSYKNTLLLKDHQQWKAVATHETRALPPVFLLAEPTSVDEHFKHLDALFE